MELQDPDPSLHPHWSEERGAEGTAAMIFAWIFGIFFLITAAGGSLNGVDGSDVGFFVMGLFALPPVRKAISKGIGVNLSGGIVVVIMLVLFMIVAGISVMIDGWMF